MNRAELSFAAACIGSIWLAIGGNPLGAPLFAVSIALAAAYFYADAVHGLAPGRKTGARQWGKPASVALAALIVLYVFFKNPVVAALAFVCLAVLVFEEVVPRNWTVKEIRLNCVELAWALAAALFAWIFLTLALGTPSPIDVVTSCSMRPVLERGDLVFLAGGETRTPSVDYGGQKLSVVKKPCTIEEKGGERQDLCTEAVIVGNRTIGFDRGNDIIVYEPEPRITDLIIHRSFAKLVGGDGKARYITRGDNNKYADQEAGLAMVPQERVHGRVVLRVPFAGYLKLFLFMQFEEPGGCDYIIKSTPQ